MRLPSFNDFSPGIIRDLRQPLLTVRALSPDREAIIQEWVADYFSGSLGDKRARTNVMSTLGNLGLIDTTQLTLTPVGDEIADSTSAQEAAKVLVRHIVDTRNGMVVFDAISALNARGEPARKDTLQRELKALGVTHLSTATTDHTTLLNWMVYAELLIKERASRFIPNEKALKDTLGISGDEQDEWSGLPLDQQIFLSILRRRSELNPGGYLQTQEIIDECLRDHIGHFRPDQFSGKVVKPLEAAGWLLRDTGPGGGRGGRSGKIVGTDKLLNIPIDRLLPDFDAIIPSDLKRRLNTPLARIKEMLQSADKNDRGLGLELLALRMIIDIGIEPRSFRARSRDTAYAEVDLTAEGRSLLFSRWTFQCKANAENSRVPLSDVAKEVGLAIYSKAHVVAIVTTGQFSGEVEPFTREITSATHLQFWLVDGDTVDAYLEKGQRALLEHLTRSINGIVGTKRGQPLAEDI